MNNSPAQRPVNAADSLLEQLAANVIIPEPGRVIKLAHQFKAVLLHQIPGEARKKCSTLRANANHVG